MVGERMFSADPEESSKALPDPDAPPIQPDLKIFDTNSRGTLYTFKLAVHYFRQQPDNEARDRCFMMTGSLNAWIDSPVSCAVLSFTRCPNCLGELGVYSVEVRPQGAHANGPEILPRARNKDQPHRTMVSQHFET